MLSEFSFCLLVPNSFLLLLEWHLFLVAWHLFLIASCYYNFCILSTQICSTIAFSTLRFTNDELVQANSHAPHHCGGFATATGRCGLHLGWAVSRPLRRSVIAVRLACTGIGFEHLWISPNHIVGWRPSLGFFPCLLFRLSSCLLFLLFIFLRTTPTWLLRWQQHPLSLDNGSSSFSFATVETCGWDKHNVSPSKVANQVGEVFKRPSETELLCLNLSSGNSGATAGGFAQWVLRRSLGILA